VEADPRTVLELDRIDKSFGGVAALTDVSMSVQAGSIVALMGENGAGKSTLSAIAAGLLRPDRGSVSVDGVVVVLHSPADAERVGVRLVPQELSLCNELSIAENVCMGGLPSRWLGIIRRRHLMDVARARLSTLGVTDLDPRRPVGNLPVVAQQFVQIARALTPDTKVLIVDEPTGPMSSAEVEQFMLMLRSVADRGVGVVFVSHRLDEVMQVCDRGVVLRDGRKTAELAAQAMTRSELATAMVGDRDLTVRAVAADRILGEPVLDLVSVHGPGLRGASLQVRAGEIVSVYGTAGSGRETLGGVIVGALKRSGGEVRVAGTQIRPNKIRAATAAGMGYVPAERRAQGLVLHASVRYNLTLATLPAVARRGVLSARRERAYCLPWLQRLQVAAPSSDVPIVTLSGGSQQKVLLARWLAADCPVLVLEDPTRGVDIATKADIWNLLRDLADAGTAILVITSDVEEAAKVGDRTAVMRQGIVAEIVPMAAEQDLVVLAMREPEDRSEDKAE
jgi:ABC-type sugar transport system ATPase subunit